MSALSCTQVGVSALLCTQVGLSPWCGPSHNLPEDLQQTGEAKREGVLADSEVPFLGAPLTSVSHTAICNFSLP